MRRPEPATAGAPAWPGTGPGIPVVSVLRFDRVERAAHWSTAVLVLVLVVTGLILYVPALSVAVGRRLVVEDVHVYCGVAVFVPLLVSLAGPWGRRLRRDLTSMSRFTTGELAWLRSTGRRGREAVGKFNPGQKLNSSAIGAILVVLLATGLVLRWGNFVAVSWRTGATLVHDWFALFAAILIVAHILMALAHPSALRSMVTGRVPARWVRVHAPAWVTADPPGAARAGRVRVAGGPGRELPERQGPPDLPERPAALRPEGP